MKEMNPDIGLKIAGSWVKLGATDGFGPLTLNEQERNVLRFIQDWTNGKQTFEFQTSGSTGNPKIIRLTRNQLITSAQQTRAALNLQPGWNALICLDVRFIAGAMMIVRSLVTGMNMVVQPPSANPLHDLSDRIDFASLVPYQIASIVDPDFQKIDAIHTIIIGGAAVNSDLVVKLQKSRSNIYATYASTETISHIALQKINGPDRQNFFQLLPGITATVDGRNCLVVRAPYLGTVVTNDVVDLFAENKFKWIARYDDVINTGGVKVNGGKIEAIVTEILNDLGLRNRIFIGGVPDEKLGEQVTVFVEGEPLGPGKEDLLRDKMQARLDKYEVPKAFKYVSQFQETASQKIDRRAVLNMINLLS
ncbi:MAG TPA: AMP-binding protein [Cyclobacteriaceae bacterium]|nr:AMP-binding protein [Cyclobacteriaceae bacterium]